MFILGVLYSFKFNVIFKKWTFCGSTLIPREEEEEEKYFRSFLKDYEGHLTTIVLRLSNAEGVKEEKWRF